jgi:type II secretory pathway component PulF
MVVGTMGMIVRNGGSVLEALGCAGKVVGGTPLGSELGVVAEKYEQGFTLAEAVRRFTSCDKAVSHMIGAGEKGGTLPEQLLLLTEMYEEQTSDSMEVFVAVSGFLTLLVSCTLIGIVFLSSILPTVLMGPKMMQAMH